MPTKIIFGPGARFHLKKVIDKMRVSRIVFVTDKGIRDAGICDAVLSQVEPVVIIDDIEQNPKNTTINRGGECVRSAADVVIGMGGGSVLDAAKALALLAQNPGTIEDYEGNQQYSTPPLPVIAIPTTCGTGSEVTWVSVITHVKRKFKMSIKGPHMFPVTALVDPDVLMTLPCSLVASTGMDALTHALEAYTVKPRSVITDGFALKALDLIFGSLKEAYTDITNKKARESIMLASTLAGIAFGNSDVGAVHCLAESVGGLYDVPHGVANSIFLPFVMAFNLSVVQSRYAHVARHIGVYQKENERDAAQTLIKAVKRLSFSLNIPSFKSLGIKKSEFLDIAQRSVQNNSNPSNPREVTVTDYVTILENAFHNTG
jgi:alcohol dehydrogenase